MYAILIANAAASEPIMPSRVEVTNGGLFTAVNVLSARHGAFVHLEQPEPVPGRDLVLYQDPMGGLWPGDRLYELAFEYPSGDITSALDAMVKAWDRAGGWGRPRVERIDGGFRVVPTEGPGPSWRSPMDCSVDLHDLDAPTGILVQYWMVEIRRTCGVTWVWMGDGIGDGASVGVEVRYDEYGRYLDPVPSWANIHMEAFRGPARLWLESLLKKTGGGAYRVSWAGGHPVLQFHHSDPMDEALSNRELLTGRQELPRLVPVVLDWSKYDPATDPFRESQLPLVTDVRWGSAPPAWWRPDPADPSP